MFPPEGEEFDEAAEDFVAVAAGEGEGELGGEEAVFDADVVAAAAQFVSEVFFGVGKLRQSRGEVERV